MSKRSKAKKKTSKAKKRSSAKKSSAKKGGKRKLSMAARKAIGAATRKRWRARKGAGRPGKTGKGHIPLRVLENNHKNLGKLIALRKKSPASWA